MKKIIEWIKKAWQWLMSFTQFLDGPNGKFSSKRLLALAFGAAAVRQLVIGDRWGALGAAVAAVILAVVTAATGT
jgi:hypothetical protein